jgi:hypothetical protein
VLGPPTTGTRLATALALVGSHRAGTLLISVPAELHDRLAGQCASAIEGVEVICFEPHPGTTRGEARYLAAIAAARHWHTVLVVTSGYHVSRARMVLNRCFDGKLLMIAAPQQLSKLRWAQHLLYETGAFIKAGLQRGC